MVVQMNARKANAETETETKTETFKVTGIGSYKNQSDFEKVANDIKSGVPGYANLLWSASVAALIHYDKHGNSLVFRPLWDAAKTFSAGEGRKWFNWLETYSKLEYNPLKLRGEKLATADFNTLFKRNKSKVSDIEGAKVHHWRDHKMERRTDMSKPIDLEKQVATFVARLAKLLQDGNRLAVFTGVGDKRTMVRKASLADVRAEVRSQLESIKLELKALPGGRKNTDKARVQNPSTVARRSPATATPKASKAPARKAQAKKAA